jgi:uncharacterized membrane protein YsdA (DUF1294 family)
MKVASTAILIFFIAVIGLAICGAIPVFLPFLYAAMSGLTIFAYAFDKRAAMTRRWRAQEQTLHLFELCGGWPGAWIAQKLFRHKGRRTSFQITFWFCVIMNIAALTWYVTRQISADAVKSRVTIKSWCSQSI